MSAKAQGALWEQRWNPLHEEWVLFASHLAASGEAHCDLPQKIVPLAAVPSFDPTCHLCPRNVRPSGARNPDYRGAHWFPDEPPELADHAPLPTSAGPHDPAGRDPLYRRAPAHGTTETVCFHPDHAKRFADLTTDEALAVVELWAERQRVVAARATIRHIAISARLESASPGHPHAQIRAASLIPNFTEREVASARQFFKKTGRYLGQGIVARELAGGAPRLVEENGEFIATVPWFARAPYEILVLPRRPAATLTDLDDGQRRDLAAILRGVAWRYDHLRRDLFPCALTLHQAPTGGGDYRGFPFHVEFQPRTPRLEMANPRIPEEDAAELRATGGPL